MKTRYLPSSKIHPLFIALAVFVTGLLLTGCSSSSGIRDSGDSTARYERNRTGSNSGGSESSRRNKTFEGKKGASESDHSQLVLSMSGWLNTPYKYGGTLKSGIDCSAYVQLMMNKAFDTNLPRTTREQLNAGTKISKSELRPGDLVFFQTGRSQYHVGIYLEDGEFTHASTSSGVTVSHIGDYYWKDRFLMARRVLDRDLNSGPTPRRALSESTTAIQSPPETPSTDYSVRRHETTPPARSEKTHNAESQPLAQANTGQKRQKRDAEGRKSSGTWTSRGSVKNQPRKKRIGW